MAQPLRNSPRSSIRRFIAGRFAILALIGGCAEQRQRSECDTCIATLHPVGWLDPTSDAFHGKELARRSWEFSLCQGCHGEDYGGKPGAPSCLSCHENGPTACDTCHSLAPTSGSHGAHLARAVACSECHIVPAGWDSPGHIFDEEGRTIESARVTFGPLANRDIAPSRRTGPPAWDRASATCTNVYCHGGTLGDAAAAHSVPVWTGGTAQVTCGSCHGVPPASHAQTECETCHPQAGAGTARHIDGTLDLGDNSGTCSACHGNAQSPAPPRGLHGETTTAERAVGAHRAHLSGGRLRGPLACAECHVVPTAIADRGHIDTSGPAQLTFGPLATADGAHPVWDRTSGTCSSVYCHGAGVHLAGDLADTRLYSQAWTANAASTVYCGACHGLPPTDASHAPTLTLIDCATCHPNTVGPFGNILLDKGKHINGVMDLQ